jgi:hypothetical protein
MVVFPHRDAGLILATSVGRYGIAHARVGHLSVLRGTAAKAGIRPHSATRRAENPNLSESNTPNVTRLIRSSSLRGVDLARNNAKRPGLANTAGANFRENSAESSVR